MMASSLSSSVRRTGPRCGYLSFAIITALLVVTACGTGGTSATSIPTTRPTTASGREPTLVVSASASARANDPHILPGDWPSFLLGAGGFNSSETVITAETAPALSRSWQAHAGGGISSEPVVVDGTVYWGSWDGYEHAASVTGQARWSTFLGKTVSPGCYPSAVGMASTASIQPVTLKGTPTLVDFVGGGDARFYALDAATGTILWSTPLGSAPGTYIWGSPVVSRGTSTSAPPRSENALGRQGASSS